METAPLQVEVPQMADADLERRVRILEAKMDELRDVPGRLTSVELQIVQLRGEMHSGFSAVQTQMQALNDQTRTEMLRLNAETRGEMVRLNADTRGEMVRLNAETREEMVRLNDETRTHMRALHEDVIARIALLHEGLLGPARGRRRPPKKRH
jgi:environmental stress-induced protein Ves